MNLRNITCILLILCWLNSCHRYCASITFGGLIFSNYDSLTDSSVTIIKCEKGSAYTQKLDSSILPVIVMQSTPPASKAGVTYDFSDAGRDYLIIVHPSGRVHHVTDINYGHEKDKGGCSGSDATRCSFGYTLDGSVFYHGSDVVHKDVRGGGIAGIEIK